MAGSFIVREPAESASAKRRSLARNEGLDLLRLVAVILVLGRHLVLPNQPGFLLSMLNQAGWIGVDLFFVLSGFLISSLLFSEFKATGDINTIRFLVRRAFKIYPPFWVFITTLLIGSLMRGGFPRLRDIAGEFLFLQNYIGALSNHTWSLAVEEHFYIAIALLLSFLLRRNKSEPFQHFSRICCAIFVFCLLTRVASFHLFPDFNWRLHVYGTHLRIDSLAFGSLIGYLWHFHDLNRLLNCVPTPVLVFVGCLLLSPSVASRLGESYFLQTFGFTLIYLGSGLLLLASLRFQSIRLPVCKRFATMGAYSYSIYLWHMAVNSTAFACFAPFANPWKYIAYALSYIVGSILFGYIMHRIIEVPSLAIRDRFFPSCQTAK